MRIGGTGLVTHSADFALACCSFRQQNRPYTALVVYENLHQRIKKPQLIRILDELSEEGALQSKDFKKVRVYLAKQVRRQRGSCTQADTLRLRACGCCCLQWLKLSHTSKLVPWRKREPFFCAARGTDSCLLACFLLLPAG